MKKLIPTVIGALAVTTLAGCTQVAHARRDRTKIADAIHAQEAQWQKDYAAKDINAIASHYTDDGVFAAPGEPLATNDTARRQAMQGLLGDPNMKLTFADDHVQVAQSGDLAYSRGRYSITVTDKATHKPATSAGSFITVWEKQGDGSWKAAEDFVTPGPAAETAAK